MRNPFKKVYCEDCQNMILDTEAWPDPDEQIEYSKCKADPIKNKRHLRKITKKPPGYWYCSSRVFPFCFKFVAKGEQDNA